MVGFSHLGASRHALTATNVSGSFSANTWYDMGLTRTSMMQNPDTDDHELSIGTISDNRLFVFMVHMNLYSNGNPTMYNANAVSEPMAISGTSNSLSTCEFPFGVFNGHAPNTAQRGDQGDFIVGRIKHIYSSSGANPVFQWKSSYALTLSGSTGGSRMSFLIFRI
jgi:hypothetical protein